MANNLPLPYYPTAEVAGVLEADILEYGNISLLLRVAKKTKKDPQAIDTLRPTSIKRTSMFFDDGLIRTFEVGIPTLDPDGNELTDKAAQKLYDQTDAHLGYFSSPKVAKKYLNKLKQAAGYVKQNVINQKPIGVLGFGLSTLDFLVSPFDIFREGEIPQSVLDSLTLQTPKLADLISIVGIAADSDEGKTISRNILSIDVDYRVEGSTEVSIKVLDVDYEMMERNYFVPRRIVLYRGREFEIAVVEVSPQDGVPVIDLKLRSRSIQRMKRDKKPENYSASNGYELAKKLANEYGLRFFGEPNPVKRQSVAKFNTADKDDSTWSMLERTASDGQSVVFEMDGTLIYATETFLMGAFGLIQGEDFLAKNAIGSNRARNHEMWLPLIYLPEYRVQLFEDSDFSDLTDILELLDYHEFRTSENDPLEASGSCSVLRPNGCLLRPGHTALCGPLPNFFFGFYLIDSVSFSECTNDPIQVTFRSPTKPKEHKKPSVGIKPGKTSFAEYRYVTGKISDKKYVA